MEILGDTTPTEEQLEQLRKAASMEAWAEDELQLISFFAAHLPAAYVQMPKASDAAEAYGLAANEVNEKHRIGLLAMLRFRLAVSFVHQARSMRTNSDLAHKARDILADLDAKKEAADANKADAVRQDVGEPVTQPADSEQLQPAQDQVAS